MDNLIDRVSTIVSRYLRYAPHLKYLEDDMVSGGYLRYLQNKKACKATSLYWSVRQGISSVLYSEQSIRVPMHVFKGGQGFFTQCELSEEMWSTNPETDEKAMFDLLDKCQQPWQEDVVTYILHGLDVDEISDRVSQRVGKVKSFLRELDEETST